MHINKLLLGPVFLLLLFFLHSAVHTDEQFGLSFESTSKPRRMSSFQEEVFCVFDTNGEIRQVRYALEAVYSSYPAVTLKGQNIIACVSKKVVYPKLCLEKHTSVYKIADGVYANVSGRAADIHYIVGKLRTLASSLEYSLGAKLTPDIVAKTLADKIQITIQRTSKRLTAFAITICGYDDGRPSVHYVDVSAVEYPCFGAAIGEKSSSMNKYLEKNYNVDNDQEVVEVAIAALLEAIGKDADANEIEARVITQDNIVHLSDQQIESILLKITEKQ